eukprot:CAMPEP_0172648002 /NCGR_PEP_ID=MMETSP1068-20121228/241044_1 /TAXON_ID=35684 /ORGANISM="Pseudopedinella elastica, Strain CCMP716" /LENGTH=96 /DNA_ID=CAMNT_0013462301 /DNA_START=216 /DNA_END=507 /DNA_ORIENTATION=-
MDPHGRVAGKQWASPAGRFAVAVDRDMDVRSRLPLERCTIAKVLGTKRSAVFESLGAPGAMDPHGRVAGKQWASPAGRFAVAVDRDMDVNLPWGVI